MYISLLVPILRVHGLLGAARPARPRGHGLSFAARPARGRGHGLFAAALALGSGGDVPMFSSRLAGAGEKRSTQEACPSRTSACVHKKNAGRPCYTHVLAYITMTVEPTVKVNVLLKPSPAEHSRRETRSRLGEHVTLGWKRDD